MQELIFRVFGYLIVIVPTLLVAVLVDRRIRKARMKRKKAEFLRRYTEYEDKILDLRLKYFSSPKAKRPAVSKELHDHIAKWNSKEEWRNS